MEIELADRRHLEHHAPQLAAAPETRADGTIQLRRRQRPRLPHRLDQDAVDDGTDHASPVVITHTPDLPAAPVVAAIPHIPNPLLLDQNMRIKRPN